jgi:hypothetical protein
MRRVTTLLLVGYQHVEEWVHRVMKYRQTGESYRNHVTSSPTMTPLSDSQWAIDTLPRTKAAEMVAPAASASQP